MSTNAPSKRRVEIVLPVPLPTWNRLLAMHPWQRMKCRHLIHLFVSLSCRYGRDWPTLTEFQGKRHSTELLRAEYFETIRPSSSKASSTGRRKGSGKKRGS